MTHQSRYYFLLKKIKVDLFAIMSIAFFLGACTKDKAIIDQVDQNTIDMLIADNFNLTLFSTLADQGGYKKVLRENKPLTALAASDQAFQDASFQGTASILALSKQYANTLMSYHVLDGQISFSDLPLKFNQVIKARNGRSLYLSRWKKDADTIVTINGAKVVYQNVKASNGIVHVIDRLLSPNRFEKVTDAVSVELELTLFHQALLRSGINELLSKSDEYTLYAPVNKAMRQYGFSSMVDINQRSPQEMLAFVKQHISPGRKFVYDYILQDVNSQKMMDNSVVTIQFTPDPRAVGSFNGITLAGAANKTPLKLLQKDIVADNGVLHLLDGVLVN